MSEKISAEALDELQRAEEAKGDPALAEVDPAEIDLAAEPEEPFERLSASAVVPIAAMKPSAALLLTALRIFSANTGVNSSQWPSPSTTGCFS